MAARHRRVLVWSLLATAMSSIGPGCGTVTNPYHSAINPSRTPSANRDGENDYSVRLEADEPKRPKTPRPPADSSDTKVPLKAVAFPQEESRPPAATQPIPSPPADLQPPPEPPALKPAPPPPIMAALIHFVENRPDRAIDALQGCPQANQQVLMRLLPLLAYLADPKVDLSDPATAQRVFEQIEGVRGTISPPLAIDKMCFCKDVKSFGCYDPLPPNHEFRACTEEHRGEQARVYLELRNLSAHAKGQFFQSAIFSRITIHDSDDKEAFRQEDANEVFQTRSPRNDVFLECQFEVPRKIPPGTYTLVIEITDKLSKPTRTTKKSIEMRIGN